MVTHARCLTPSQKAMVGVSPRLIQDAKAVVGSKEEETAVVLKGPRHQFMERTSTPTGDRHADGQLRDGAIRALYTRAVVAWVLDVVAKPVEVRLCIGAIRAAHISPIVDNPVGKPPSVNAPDAFR